MAAPRHAVALACLLLAAPLAGCNFKDFYNQMGTFHVVLVPQGPENSSLTDFRSLKIAVYGVSLRQQLTLQPKEFSFGEAPLVVDFLEAGLKGERIPLATGKMNLRAVDNVTLRLDVIEAVDAQGKDIPTCYEGEPVESFPCFYMPTNNAYRLQEPQFAPPRGGTVTFGFPLAVKTITVQGDTEYFFVGDPADAIIEKKR
ncbi:MAG TPA: hypothetical protein VNX21_07470 [Candidatus Thermoplasmatota archaeon]|nr:hypothetical protein [Candidatus Thermoplasmatota archaeon]